MTFRTYPCITPDIMQQPKAVCLICIHIVAFVCYIFTGKGYKTGMSDLISGILLPCPSQSGFCCIAIQLQGDHPFSHRKLHPKIKGGLKSDMHLRIVHFCYYHYNAYSLKIIS